VSWMETVGGLLKQYSGQTSQLASTERDFDHVASSVPSSALGSALGDMFRSSHTPPFAQLAAQMFGSSNGTQKANVLNELMSAAGPALTTILGNAGLGALASKLPTSGAITPETAEQVPPQVVEQVAKHVEERDPTIVDRLGAIYAEHPTLVKTLGSAVLAVTLAKLANRTGHS